MYSPRNVAEKYLLARQAALETQPENGLCGFELEWNLFDEQFKPLLTVGTGPSQLSFVDFLRAECLPGHLGDYSQLEVFHWMIEWATRPYYLGRGAVYEGRLMEAALINALQLAGKKFGQRLFYLHGNLPILTEIGVDSIPTSWGLAKRRYLERCIRLYGNSLATAGTHTNLSLPDPLFAWDFMHLPTEKRGSMHLDEYKSEFYITATRLMRAFASLFIATSASTPFQSQVRDGKSQVILTDMDSIRSLTFPNPHALDLPNLYRSYDDYLQISYDLVKRGVRFGNNNWTPVRARSFAERVERLIAVTSDQLDDLYARGLYALGMPEPAEEMARQIEIQNLLSRINLPMVRVEVRTDDGGHPIEIDVANLTLKNLLMLRFYSDQEFGRAFRYDAEDIALARRNEEQSASHGLKAEIENPFTGKPIEMRLFLQWTLDELWPLAKELGCADDLQPLLEMARGGPNTAEKIRNQYKKDCSPDGVVPLALLQQIAEEREEIVRKDVERIAETYTELSGESTKLNEFLQYAREATRQVPDVRIRYRPRPDAIIEMGYPDKTSEIVALAKMLIKIPSVTACPDERLEEVRKAGTFIYDYLRDHGIGVRYHDQEKYPALLAGFPGELQAPVMLGGHFDVVEPEPDDSQFEPRVEGDYLWGRGAADMKTVAATYLVWLKDMQRAGPPYPPVNLLLVGNEENGEGEPMGSPHFLRFLMETERYEPDLFVAGERTGEKGDELWGEICTENRGVMRFDIMASGQRGHSGLSGTSTDLLDRLLCARSEILDLMRNHLTLKSPDGWQSQVKVPFVQVGTPGVYNITPDKAVMGMEIRSIPQDNLDDLMGKLQQYCEAQNLNLQIRVKENGIACDPANLYLQSLIHAVETSSGAPAKLGRKLPGTSARFAPQGQGVVWGQSGLGPHARDERHYIPSIFPYYQALCQLKTDLLNMRADD